MEISNGRFFWSRGATIGPLALPESNRRANFPDDTTSSNLVWQAMVSGLFDFQSYDINRDGHVSQNELQLAIISNDADGGGAERWAGQVRPNGLQVDWTGSVALLGHRGDFATLCHELSHTLGTLDLYGVWSQECLSYEPRPVFMSGHSLVQQAPLPSIGSRNWTRRRCCALYAPRPMRR